MSRWFVRRHIYDIAVREYDRLVVEKPLGDITISPNIQFGRPCIAGTGIPAEIIHERFKAGDSAMELARDYGVTEKQIQSAIDYEEEK